jgi:hypothetical protein
MSFDRKSAVMSGQWLPSLRYPDPLITALDPRFKQYHLPLTSVERLYTGTRWSEGPVWFGDARSLIWSDVPGDCMYRWDEETGNVAPFRKPSNNANGNTRDRQGRLVTCEHLTRRGDLRQLRGQAVEFAERRGCEIGRLDLVHRPAIRHSRQLRRQQGGVGIADERLSRRRQDRRGNGGGRRH